MRNKKFQRLVSTIATISLILNNTAYPVMAMTESDIKTEIKQSDFELPSAGVSNTVDIIVEDAKKKEITSSIKMCAENMIEKVEYVPPKTIMQEYIECGPTEREAAEFNNNNIDHPLYSSGYYMVLNRNFTTMTKEEFNMLCRIINAEARGENDEAQQAVGQVVLNRVDSDKFPNDIISVIYQKGQFTPVSNGQINLTPEPRVIENAKKVLLDRWLPSNALFFTSYKSYGFFKAYEPYRLIDDTCVSLWGEVIYEDEK